MLIDVSSFTSGPRQIENAVATPKTPNNTAVAERINGYIEFYQLKFLLSAVGKELAKVIDDYSKVDHNEPDEVTEGLIASLREPFADFVFFYMLRDMNTQNTITGLVQLKCANSYVAPIDKGVQSWNRMVDGLKQFIADAIRLGVKGVTTDKDMLTYLNNLNL